MTVHVTSGSLDELNNIINELIKQSRNIDYIIDLYVKIMYDMHILTYDVINNTHLFKESLNETNISGMILKSAFDKKNILSLFINDNNLYIITNNFLTTKFIESFKFKSCDYNVGYLSILPKSVAIEIYLVEPDVEGINIKFNSASFDSVSLDHRKIEFINFIKNCFIEEELNDFNENKIIIKDETWENIKKTLIEET